MNISEFSKLFAQHHQVQNLITQLQQHISHKAVLQKLCGSMQWFIGAHIFSHLSTHMWIIMPNNDMASYVHSDLASIIGAKHLLFIPP